MAARKEAAAEVYERNLQLVQQQIATLQKKVKAHKDAAKRSPRNWGFAGELGYVREQLSDLNGFLGSF